MHPRCILFNQAGRKTIMMTTCQGWMDWLLCCCMHPGPWRTCVPNSSRTSRYIHIKIFVIFTCRQGRTYSFVQAKKTKKNIVGLGRFSSHLRERVRTKQKYFSTPGSLAAISLHYRNMCRYYPSDTCWTCAIESYLNNYNTSITPSWSTLLYVRTTEASWIDMMIACVSWKLNTYISMCLLQMFTTTWPLGDIPWEISIHQLALTTKWWPTTHLYYP